MPYDAPLAFGVTADTTTAVPPPLNAPLMTIEELATWVRLPEIPTDQQDFAWKAIEGASVVVREAGSIWWTTAVDPLPTGHIRIPYRAKLLLDLKVKNFFEHPTGAVSETVGPLSERYLDEVVQQIQLSDDEEQLLAQLAAEGGAEMTYPAITGIWALSTTRGTLETHDPAVRGVIHIPSWREGAQAYPYFADGSFGSPLTEGELLP